MEAAVLQIRPTHLELSVRAVFDLKLLRVLLDRRILLLNRDLRFVLRLCSANSLATAHF